MMIAWNGIGQPTKFLDRKVRVKLRSGRDNVIRRVGELRWEHNGGKGDIVAYTWVDEEVVEEVVEAGGQRVAEDDRRGNGEVAGPTGKQSNPKDLVGSRKAPLSTLPFRVLWRVGLAMLEGMCKYGRHNYRAVGVRASVYFDGAMRHIGAWWEGEDIDADSGFHHIDKLIADLMVLRDSMLQGNWVDDRPPSAKEDFPRLHTEAARIVDLHADKKPHHFTIADSAGII